MGAYHINKPLLETRQLVKKYGGIVALDGIDLMVRKATVHAIIGPNGAGKTTLVNVISGLVRPQSGTVFFNGHKITTTSCHVITTMGIGRTFQNLRVFGGMSVLENVLIGYHCRTKGDIWNTFFRLPFKSLVQEGEMVRQALGLLESVGLEDRANTVASGLPLVERRKLEIARALATQPQLLLLDEPTAGMGATESEGLGDLIMQLSRTGIAILLIAHDMSLVMNVAQMVTVLNFGEKITEGSPSEIRSNPAVMEAYLGVEE